MTPTGTDTAWLSTERWSLGLLRLERIQEPDGRSEHTVVRASVTSEDESLKLFGGITLSDADVSRLVALASGLTAAHVGAAGALFAFESEDEDLALTVGRPVGETSSSALTIEGRLSAAGLGVIAEVDLPQGDVSAEALGAFAAALERQWGRPT